MAVSNLSQPSTLILGAGVFGASTAYSLAQEFPASSVTLVDRMTGAPENAASWDWNKVVRADYEDPFYMKLGLEALDHWIHDPLYSQFFHPNGAAWLMPDPKYPERVANNYRQLGRELDFEIIPAEEMRKRYDGLFMGTDMSGVGNIFLNRQSGWADAKDALAALINEAVKAGVKNVALDVQRLIIDKDGAVEGVEDVNGKQLKADRVILCTGAYTAKLLADTAPDKKDWHVGNRLVAAAVVEGTLQLDPQRLEKFIKGPVFIHNVGVVQGDFSLNIFWLLY
jgi:sarcosine oxidase/L-pipecolate oxidase